MKYLFQSSKFVFTKESRALTFEVNTKNTKCNVFYVNVQGHVIIR